MLQERYNLADLQQEVWEVLWDRHGRVCSLLDFGGSMVETKEGDVDFLMEEGQLDLVLMELESITGYAFRPATVADPERYRCYRAVR